MDYTRRATRAFIPTRSALFENTHASIQVRHARPLPLPSRGTSIPRLVALTPCDAATHMTPTPSHKTRPTFIPEPTSTSPRSRRRRRHNRHGARHTARRHGRRHTTHDTTRHGARHTARRHGRRHTTHDTTRRDTRHGTNDARAGREVSFGGGGGWVGGSHARGPTNMHRRRDGWLCCRHCRTRPMVELSALSHM